MEINRNTKVVCEFESAPVSKAVEAVKRDIKNTCLDTDRSALDIVLIEASDSDNIAERFVVRAMQRDGKDTLLVEAQMSLASSMEFTILAEPSLGFRISGSGMSRYWKKGKDF